jgi:hypothetical protein
VDTASIFASCRSLLTGQNLTEVGHDNPIKVVSPFSTISVIAQFGKLKLPVCAFACLFIDYSQALEIKLSRSHETGFPHL